jgi:hypothetical protein
MNARVFASVMVCAFLFALSACEHVQESYPASTPPGELAPPTAPPSPVPLSARQAIPAIRAEQARINRGVYVVCIANDGSLPRSMTSALASTRGWLVLRDGQRVRAICPIAGRARILHALRAHDGAILFDARIIPVAAIAHLGVAHPERLPLMYCAPYSGAKAACSPRTSSAGSLRDVGRDFTFAQGGA